MKRLFLILAIVSVSVACKTFDPVKKPDAPIRLNFPEDMSLYGDVETMYITTYDLAKNKESNDVLCEKQVYRFDERGSVVECSLFNSSGALIERQSYVYDDNANMLEKCDFYPYEHYQRKYICTYNSDNKIISQTCYSPRLLSKRNYKYDAMGNLVKETFYDYFYKAGEVTIYKYNSEGQLVEELFSYDNYEGRDCYADGTFPILYTTYKYDSAGRLIETAGYDSKNCHMLGYLYQKRYDSMGNLIEEDRADYIDTGEVCTRSVSFYSSDVNNNLLEVRWSWGSTTYIYDSANNLIEEVSYDKSGAISSRVVYTYDAFGNNIEMARYSEDNTLTSKSLYSYDDRGNMIEKTNDHTRVVYEISYRTQPAQVE